MRRKQYGAMPLHETASLPHSSTGFYNVDQPQQLAGTWSLDEVFALSRDVRRRALKSTEGSSQDSAPTLKTNWTGHGFAKFRLALTIFFAKYACTSFALPL